MKKHVENIIFIVFILVIITIIINVMINKYVTFFGFSIFQVATGSMEDTINIGDIVIVKKSNDYNVDDIVAYKDSKIFILHRITKINGDNITTKGDSNNTEDEPINKNQIIGKVVLLIKSGGTDAKRNQ